METMDIYNYIAHKMMKEGRSYEEAWSDLDKDIDAGKFDEMCLAIASGNDF